MTDAEAVAALETYFASNWTETDIFFNQVPGNPVSGTEFVSFWVFNSSTYQTAIATNPEFRTGCVIQVDINIPAGTGTRRAIALGDQVSALFLGKQVSGVTIRDKFVSEVVVEDFYRRVISFNGYYAQ